MSATDTQPPSITNSPMLPVCEKMEDIDVGDNKMDVGSHSGQGSAPSLNLSPPQLDMSAGLRKQSKGLVGILIYE